MDGYGRSNQLGEKQEGTDMDNLEAEEAVVCVVKEAAEYKVKEM